MRGTTAGSEWGPIEFGSRLDKVVEDAETVVYEQGLIWKSLPNGFKEEGLAPVGSRVVAAGPPFDPGGGNLLLPIKPHSVIYLNGVHLNEDVSEAVSLAADRPAGASTTFTDRRSLWTALDTKDTVLLKGTWLINRHSIGGLLPRRQDMAAEGTRCDNGAWRFDL